MPLWQYPGRGIVGEVTAMRLMLVLTGQLLLSFIVQADNLLGLPAVQIPADNPQTAEKIKLGRMLFNDSRFSGDGSISCASCHQQSLGFSDGVPRAVGINGQTGQRNTPGLINAAYYFSLFLDGRAESLEEQAIGPLLNPIEHGLTDAQWIINVIVQDLDYVTLFKNVYGVALDEINMNLVVKSLASYQRSLVAGNSPFDRYLFGRDKTAMTPAAVRGYKIFRRKGNCANCHEISWDHALFTDNRFYNIGIGFERLQPVISRWTDSVEPRSELDSLKLTPLHRSELGRYAVTGEMKDLGKFKTPGLRNITLTAPYMHDGSLKTLEEVVEYYDKGGEPNAYLDPAIFPLQLTQQEKADLLAFLQALDSDSLVLPVEIEK